ncbi:hypothetical protein H4R21_005410 [Coemansia helicoidea]|uniref:Uncharacterized protein n=1 Tax=Coemansia helicoidea TaxID=1286919 RepID=A0ACC1KTJ6_9FUNG|nr:hypothetical protein H4R21_005410 [Coemansia helicoidea]
MVYNCVFVKFGEYLESREDPHNPLLEAPPDVLVKTNLDLVAMVGRARAVKRVEIDVFCLGDPFPWWRDIIQRMRAVASKWRVVELRVITYSQSYESIHSDRAVDQFADDVAETCDALTTLMPDVNHLECDIHYSNAIAQLLYGRLASLYAKQLLWFDSEDSIITPPGCQFPGLKWLRLKHRSLAGHQFPQIASGGLVNLRLFGGLPNQSWMPFSTDDDSQVIEFTNLKRLHVVRSDPRPYDDGTVHYRDGHPWELHFPSLESLSISTDEEICPLLKYAVLPPRMESISIDIVLAAYKDIEDVVLPETKHLSLRINSGYGGDMSGLSVINRIVEGAHGSETVEMTIEDIDYLVPEITCTALTQLEVRAMACVDDMLVFIDRLPNLIELTFFTKCLGDP